jgi:hypothetical protein
LRQEYFYFSFLELNRK